MSEVSLARNSAVASPRLSTARLKLLLTELNLHLVGVALLLLLNLYLLVHMFFSWREIRNNNAAALEEQKVQMHTAEIAAEPLRGIDKKVQLSTEQADRFYTQRLPFADSQIAAELGLLARRENVRLTRSEYSYKPVLDNTGHDLEEVQIDTSLGGDYRPLVHVVNMLERDKLFFLIESLTLTGQQSGAVNLRLRLATYMRPPVGDEVSKAIKLEDTAPAAGTLPTAVPIVPVRPAGLPGRPMPMPPNRTSPATRPMPRQFPAGGPQP